MFDLCILYRYKGIGILKILNLFFLLSLLIKSISSKIFIFSLYIPISNKSLILKISYFFNLVRRYQGAISHLVFFKLASLSQPQWRFTAVRTWRPLFVVSPFTPTRVGIWNRRHLHPRKRGCDCFLGSLLYSPT